MATNIKHKRSSVSGSVPSLISLELGELAINTFDGKLFLKKNDGTETIVDVTKELTASEILAQILTVDGIGSGLDADLLDGQQGSYFLDWTNVTNKPSPVLTISGDATGSATFNSLGDTTLSITVVNDSHQHSFNNLLNKELGTGNYATSGQIIAGSGSGSVALTVNDVGGNANVTFNHRNIIPEQSGNSARIHVNVDSSTDAAISFSVKSGVTSGIETPLSPVMQISETIISAENGAIFSGNLAGNSTTATTLQTPRTIWGQNFDGSGNISGNLTSVGNITGSGAITITAGGSNQNITLSPSGVGTVNASTFNGRFQGIEADTSSVPSFTWTNDLNTGMYHAAADQIGFTTGGTNRVIINAAGLTVNNGRLATTEINRGASQQLILFAGDSVTSSGYTGLINELVYVVAEDGMQVISSSNNWVGGWSTAVKTVIGNSSGESHFPGKLGVGTSTPRSGIHIYGDGQTTSNLSDSDSLDSFIRVSHAGTTAGSGGGIIFASRQSDDTQTAGMAAIKGLLVNGNTNTIGHLAFSTRGSNIDTSLTERMRITYDGKVGIGTFTGLEGSLTLADYINVRRNTNGWLLKHERTDDTQIVGIQAAGHPGTVGLTFYTNDTEQLRISSTGAATFTREVTAIDFNTTSDIRVKENIEPIQDALDKLQAINGVTFNFISDSEKLRHAGVIAQDVEKVLPEAVKELESGIKHVAYGNLIGLLIEAIKEQQKQIDALKVLLNK